MPTSAFPFDPYLAGLPGSEAPSLISDILALLPSGALLPLWLNLTFRLIMPFKVGSAIVYSLELSRAYPAWPSHTQGALILALWGWISDDKPKWCLYGLKPRVEHLIFCQFRTRVRKFTSCSLHGVRRNKEISSHCSTTSGICPSVRSGNESTYVLRTYIHTLCTDCHLA